MSLLSDRWLKFSRVSWQCHSTSRYHSVLSTAKTTLRRCIFKRDNILVCIFFPEAMRVLFVLFFVTVCENTGGVTVFWWSWQGKNWNSFKLNNIETQTFIIDCNCHPLHDTKWAAESMHALNNLIPHHVLLQNEQEDEVWRI